MSDNAVDYCSKIERKRYDNILRLDDFKQGLHFARENFYTPVIVYENRLRSKLGTCRTTPFLFLILAQ